MRPLIGLTTSEIRHPVKEEQIPHADAAREEVVLGNGYMRAIAKAGGAPVVLPPLDPELAPSMVAPLAGLCVSGGPDVDPDSYGSAERHERLGPTVPEIDRFELAAIAEARRRGMPVLAICRGAQVLNVAHGGDLIQHLPDEVGETVRHQRETPTNPVIWHEVEVDPDSVLARALGTNRLEVNSFHHQAPRHVGDGLRVVARAADGVVEGMEGPGADFEVAVQWHPEGIVDRPEQLALFRAFVDAARRYAERTPSTAATAADSQAPGSSGAARTGSTGIR